MPLADDVSAPPRGTLGLPVPAAGPGICRLCHGPARRGRAECFCCSEVGQLLGERPGEGPVVAPIAACRPGDRLHSALRRYKDAPSVAARRHYVTVLAQAVEQFLAFHLACLLSSTGGWDAFAVVPSSTRAPAGRPVVHPLQGVLQRVPLLAGVSSLCLERGTAGVGHLTPDSSAFVGPAAVSGRRVLLVDDTWVTGATARSAAGALASSGASVPAVLVLGRAVDPCAGLAPSRWWEWCQQLAARGVECCCLSGCRRAPEPSSTS